MKNDPSATVEITPQGTLPAKKRKVLLLICGAVLLAVAVTLILVGYYCGWYGGVYGLHKYDRRLYNIKAIAAEQLSVHFLQTYGGNGDCIYIKAGDTDVLIDAGPTPEGAASVAQYIDRFCTDGVLEYVVVTHADADHIAGFVGTSSIRGIFKRYDCRTIIQFSQSRSSSDIFYEYCRARDEEIAHGADCYTALQCCRGENGAQRIYELNDGITLEVLYQQYYEQATDDDNDCSVCILVRQGDNSYLFTGDLGINGESSLLSSNPGLGNVTLYKAGHHGSSTSSNMWLLENIRPQYVCVCCVAGSVEYTQNAYGTFPTQDFIDRISHYTDNVYVTGRADTVLNDNGRIIDVGYRALNGDIVFACSDGKISTYFSENDSKLKDSDWFQSNRRLPAQWSIA